MHTKCYGVLEGPRKTCRQRRLCCLRWIALIPLDLGLTGCQQVPACSDRDRVIAVVAIQFAIGGV